MGTRAKADGQVTNWVAEAYRRLGGETATVIKTGISASTLQRWRKIRYIADTDVLFKVAELTGISPWLLAGKTEPRGGSSGSFRWLARQRKAAKAGRLPVRPSPSAPLSAAYA